MAHGQNAPICDTLKTFHLLPLLLLINGKILLKCKLEFRYSCKCLPGIKRVYPKASIFHYSKNYGSLTLETKLKVEVKMADLARILETVRTLNTNL